MIHSMTHGKIVFVWTFVLSVSLLLFTYTQVDLGLTLSQQSIVRDIQSVFQHIGFYQRPVATVWFILNIAGLVSLLGMVVLSITQSRISVGQLVVLIGVLTVVLFFSYPAAFSYDIYNYIFTAKTVVFYGKNPYQIIPLQLEGIDSMLSFMRWTHLPSAYTPIWILLTLPFYLLSFGSLFLSLFTVKMLGVISYLISGLLIYAILHIEDKKSSLLGLALFAFNPLIIVESLISGHNDIVMMMFALLSYYFYLKNNRFRSLLSLAISVSIKLMTATLLPLVFIPWKRERAVLLLALGLVAVLMKREFLPWYFVWIIPFSSLLPKNKWLQFFVISLSLGLICTYTPVLYLGSYNNPVASIQSIIIASSVVVGLVGAGSILLSKKH